MKEIKNNVDNVALILEGGGMRASFSSGIINTLLDYNIYFNYITGISAGTSLLANYMSRDKDRTKKSFVDFASDPNFGGMKTFFRGKGFFNSNYIYYESAKPGNNLPFDFKTFFANPARYRIIAYDAYKGRKKVFTENDVKRKVDIMKMVKASSSLPIFMPPTKIGDSLYFDGGLTGGIPVEEAMNDGYEKFFIVRTQERGYRKSEIKNPNLIKLHFRNYPKVGEAIIKRPKIYNRQCDLVEKLEAEGKAIVIYPEVMDITNKEKNLDKLQEKYDMGYEYGRAHVLEWLDFLNT